MGRYILRRLLQAIPLMLGITLLTFVIVNLVPGSPISDIMENPNVRQEDIERIERNLGLDKPVHLRYFIWVGNVLRGDLGISMKTFRPVGATIVEKLPNTLLLTGTAMALSVAVSLPVGISSAVKKKTWYDNAATAAAVAGFSVPTFWLGLMLILLFAVKFSEWSLPALPAGGAIDLRGGGGLLDRVEHLILPAFALAFVQTAYWTRFIRSQFIEVLSQDYMRSARAKGLREWTVLSRHGLRNAVLPLVTLLGISIPELFGGALIVEQIFAWPGMGQLAYNAAISKDYPLIMGTVLLASALVILGNLAADVLYGLIDPRIRY